jgi:threonine aldolase
MARLLARGLSEIEGITLTQEVQANEVFAVIPGKVITKLQERWPFHVWDEKKSEARLITSFDTTEEDVADFIGLAREKMGSREKQWT